MSTRTYFEVLSHALTAFFSHQMGMHWYFIVQFIINFLFHILSVALIGFVGYLAQVKLFTQSSMPLFIFMAAWGLPQASLSFCLSMIFNKMRTAQMMAFVVIFGFIAGSVVLNATQIAATQVWYLNVVPHFA